MISKNTYGFSTVTNPDRFVDRNTLLIDERETGERIPHFHAGLTDFRELFDPDWSFAILPRETNDIYDLEKPEYFSKHWQVLLKKKS